MANYTVRLPTATVYAAVTFTPPDNFWPKIQELGGQLDEHQQAELLAVIRRYYDRVQFEWNAPRIADAETRLREITAAARTLVDAICNDVGSEAARHLDSKLNWYLRNSSRFRLYDPSLVGNADGVPAAMAPCIDDLVVFLEDLQAAGEEASRHLDEVRRDRPYRPGQSWDEMLVDGLIDFYRATIGEPTATKPGGNTLNPSPLIRFVAAVQAAMPPNFRLHDASMDVLATAVAKCLRANKAKGARITGREQYQA